MKKDNNEKEKKKKEEVKKLDDGRTKEGRSHNNHLDHSFILLISIQILSEKKQEI